LEIVIPDIREQVAQVTHKLLSGIMKDWKAIQKPYLQDSLPIRLGGIAANLGRVKSFTGTMLQRNWCNYKYSYPFGDGHGMKSLKIALNDRK
jgi:hypothetical protein